MTNQQIRLIKKPEVLRRTGYSNSSLYVKINDTLFVPPVLTGARSVAWIEYEMDAILSALVAEKTNEEIKNLVSRLIADRKMTSELNSIQSNLAA